MPEKEAQLGFSLKGLIVLLLIGTFLLGMLIPAILNSREKVLLNYPKELGRAIKAAEEKGVVSCFVVGC